MRLQLGWLRVPYVAHCDLQSNPIFFLYVNIIAVNFLRLMTWLEDEQQELYISGYEAFLLDLKRRLRDLKFGNIFNNYSSSPNGL